MNRSIVLSHPGCGPFVQQAARALHEAGLLSVYVTTFHYERSSSLCRSLRVLLRARFTDPEKQLIRRRITEVPPELIRGYPLPELIRMMAAYFGPIVGDLMWAPTEKWFDGIVARHHLQGTTVLYGYEHACLQSFIAQKARGGFCIYDMPITHHATTSRWLKEEFHKYPELSTPYEDHLQKLAAKRNRRKDAELALADRVVVSSDFVRNSIISAGVPKEKIWLVPSGAPPVDTTSRAADPRRFIFLAAGHLSVRKGIHYLLTAWRKLCPPAHVELWLVGKWQLPDAMRQGLPGKVWIQDTVPREELYRLFDRTSALVFPTLVEGLALTPLQAMARAVPVITTPNSGADIFIRDGENGRLIPPADPDALVSVLAWAIHHPHIVREMGFRAAQRVANWQWGHYRAALGKLVTDFVMNSDVGKGIVTCGIGS